MYNLPRLSCAGALQGAAAEISKTTASLIAALTALLPLPAQARRTLRNRFFVTAPSTPARSAACNCKNGCGWCSRSNPGRQARCIRSPTCASTVITGVGCWRVS